MALQMMAAAWSTLKRETIFNCFKHCGFGNNQAATSSTEAEDEPASEQAEDALIASQWMDLEDKGFVAADLQLDDFVNVDANVEVYEELTDAEIVESAQKRGDVSSSGEDDPQDTPTPATASKVMDAFDIIRKVIGAHDDDIAMALLTDSRQRGQLVKRPELGHHGRFEPRGFARGFARGGLVPAQLQHHCFSFGFGFGVPVGKRGHRDVHHLPSAAQVRRPGPRRHYLFIIDEAWFSLTLLKAGGIAVIGFTSRWPDIIQWGQL
ncbi:hypothetical protein HPB48_009123 [Haemaphysalis longicornis]|uniref:Uncharacterized protein n=1 Tax=Haemaphysalis longicornis TaxID=44386 RepID=A0A9J6GZ81_HAELO|nr:hypothetical protein HPB48_009123 [Haemaphysalis longicornis]